MLSKTVAKSHKGFSLIEVMVVVVILGILAAIVVPRIISRPEEAKIVKAKQDILVIESAMELYKLDNGVYPSTDQGIQALVTKPSSEPIPQNWKQGGYLKSLPVDSWGRTYHYLDGGGHNPDGIDIFTYGANGQPSGTGSNATIGNWTVAKKS